MKNYSDFHKVAAEDGLLRAIYIGQVNGVSQYRLHWWVKHFNGK